jgi:CBS domain-containing protein
MKTVKQLLQNKGGEVWTIGPDQTVLEALRLMAEKEVGALVVVNSSKVVGIISERDYARKVVLRGVSSKDTPVRDIMSGKVFFVRPNQTAEECLALMTEKRCRHLPVMEDNKLSGLISIGDAVKAVIAEKEFMIGQLENYIKGG